MTIIGIGLDIIEVERIRKVQKKYKDDFARRILRAEEFDQYKKK